MKILRYLLIAFGVILALLLVLSFIGPKNYDVSRSIVINAPKTSVFPHLKSLQKMQAWSPWAELDPNMKNTFTGEDGTVGSSNSWEGNDQVGAGSQTITVINENESVETHLHFLKPFESESDAYMKTEDSENGSTKVTWGIKGDNNFMGRIMGLFMNMDAMIGKDFEKGLDKLKTIVESQPAQNTYRGFSITEEDFAGKMYVGIRETVKFADMKQFFSENFASVFSAVGDKADGMPSGIYFEWDEANQKTDMAAAVAVKKTVKGFEKFEIPASKMLLINYQGGYNGLGEAHYAMDDYIKEKGYKISSPVVEEYVTDPGNEPDSTKWVTKVMYFVEK